MYLAGVCCEGVAIERVVYGSVLKSYCKTVICKIVAADSIVHAVEDCSDGLTVDEPGYVVPIDHVV